jgi:hypothetical protein
VTGVPPPPSSPPPSSSPGTWQQWIDEGRDRFHKREGVRVKQAGKAFVKKEKALRKLREKEHDQMEKYVDGGDKSRGVSYVLWRDDDVRNSMEKYEYCIYMKPRSVCGVWVEWRVRAHFLIKCLSPPFFFFFFLSPFLSLSLSLPM